MSKIAGGNRLLNPQTILREAGVGLGDVVGDLGVGTAAYFTLQVADMVGDKGRVYAVDIQKSVLQNVEHYAKQHRFLNITPLWANLEVPRSTQIPDHELDFALVVNVLFQTPRPEAILKEAVRMTKHGGKILVVDWTDVNTPFGPGPGDRLERVRVEQTLNSLGVKLERVVDAGKYHYGLLFQAS
ncbi:MAG: methyltransferase domain-containing protein [Candidatus Kerfeldbacteria bacterium]|nr:methyltransferase domain-containing protein [Candidatus Kerfeldbacteria bacterium]